MKLEFVKAKKRYYIIGVNSKKKRYVDPASVHDCRATARDCSGGSCGHQRVYVNSIMELNEETSSRQFCLPKEGILEE
jgi:hypothetical protein